MTSTDLAARMANNSLAETDHDIGPNIKQTIERQIPEIEKAMGDALSAQRLARLVASEIKNNPKLGECTPMSIMGAVMQSAQLQLEPGPLGHCYYVPIPRNVKIVDPGTGEEEWIKELNCEWWLGYKGMADLARRQGTVAGLAAEAVYDADDFSASLGTNGYFRWARDYRLSLADRGDPYAYFARVAYTNGGEDWAVLTMEEVKSYRNRSANWQNAAKYNNGDRTPWGAEFTDPDDRGLDFDAMAKKTCIRRLATLMPSNPQLLSGIAADGAVSTWEPGQAAPMIENVDAPELVPSTEGELPAGVVVDEETGEMWEETD